MPITTEELETKIKAQEGTISQLKEEMEVMRKSGLMKEQIEKYQIKLDHFEKELIELKQKKHSQPGHTCFLCD